MFIDTHAHLEYPDFESDFDQVINRAKEKKIEKIINVGSTFEGSKNSILLAKKYKGIIYSSIGIHPHHAIDLGRDPYEFSETRTKTLIEALSHMAKEKEVVAIGEIGLDFFRENSRELRKKQVDLFKSQLAIAVDFNLPIIVHSREAEDDTMTELVKQKNKIDKGVVHCFTGSYNFAKKVLDLGFYVGFTGIITFEKSSEIQEVVKKIPLERILLETDAPYLAPTPHRGKRNEPSFVIEVAKKIAELKGISLEEVEEATTKSAIDLFGLK